MQFHLSGYVNNQNSHIWSVTNLDQIKGTSTDDQKVGVSCAISRNPIIGPIFIYDTINSECYCEVILYRFPEHLNEDETACGHFQQDSATAHTAPVSMTLQHSAFRDRIISKDIWPPHLPDITSPFYYLWEAMKCAVYSLWAEGSHHKFHQEHPSDWTVTVSLRIR
jgi:hypothetical protein